MQIISWQDINQKKPEVTVIIPTYNRCLMLQEALTSVTCQQFDGFVEIIVIDDNSQDSTSEIVRQKYPFVRLIHLTQNVGPSAARNQAILQSQGRYIAFLDSDDLWEPNHLKTQVLALKGKEKSLSVSSNLVIWNLTNDCKQTKTQRPNLKKYTSTIHHLFVAGFIITLSSVVIPREAFTEVGLFDENMRLGEDNELCLRCLLFGYNLICTEQPTVVKREHGQEQLTDKKNLQLKERYRFMRINKLYPLTKQCFDTVSIQQIYAETHAIFARQYLKNYNFLNWIRSSIAIAHNSSPKYAVINTICDIKHLLSNAITTTYSS
jgi:glycosyltransferase involved in cell wall biosynthesis